MELLPSAAEMTQPPPVVEELPKAGADKQGTETALEKSPPPRDVQQQASSDFIPEEPTSGQQQEVKVCKFKKNKNSLILKTSD